MQKILNKYLQHPKITTIVEKINTNNEIQLKNAFTSAKSFTIATIYLKLNKPIIIILSDKENAAYLYNDLQTILPNEKIFFFPSTIRQLSHNSGTKIDKAATLMRTETLTEIRNPEKQITVTYPEAIAETVINKNEIPTKTIELNINEEIDQTFLIEMLKEFNFVKNDFVYEPGQYAVRGSIIDIFSYAEELPYRIDFFGDEIESIRIFDIETQLSVKKIKNIRIITNIATKNAKSKTSFLKFIPNNSIIISDNFKTITENIQILHENKKNNPEKIEYTKTETFFNEIKNFKKINLSNKKLNNKIPIIQLNITPQPKIQKNFNLIANDLKNKQQNKYNTFILIKNQKQTQRLKEILQSKQVENKISFEHIKAEIHEGFTDNDIKITAYTDHQIFDRYHRFFLKKLNYGKAKQTQLLKEIKELNTGDYIVHIDHGIGIFKGLTTINNNGKKQEVVQIEYKDNDNLFLSIHALHKISKYKNQDTTEQPKIHKLGTNIWKNTKNKTKKRIKDIAKDLIQLYAKRMQEKGYAFEHDSYLQDALEAAFIYEETPDQLETITNVKMDMEKQIPMDRLVCGDVGFGKTEIAIRAAFKAVNDNKQVALLCPTTILTYQHFQTFSERLKDMPVNIEFLCRMKTAKQQKQIIQKLKNGKIDIIIGTHRLVSKDVIFSDLGLLIIDEEQKFGVTVKEKLKQLRINVDTLTLTATPIPRTLEFSLMGARDLSILQTPPKNRQPIITELHTFNKKIIQNAINYEIKRGGQIFFVHNHVATLPKIKKHINSINPNVSIQIVHGQMKPLEIENAITNFIKGNYDILLTTTIIENGLDIPNANTIIINNAHNFGLSDLHQLRGRVGRSQRKAFCFLIAPPINNLKEIARKRLNAIENFVELGSGFNIALQDLDIRGAGDILGAEQSGFINNIGYETFKRILQETMLELKTTEYKHIFNNENNKNIENQNFVSDCQITTSLNIGFANNFIKNNNERLKLYRELNNINNNEKLNEFENKITDRFGKIPTQAQELINIVRIRIIAVKLGIEKITINNNALVCFFVADQKSAFYDSKTFAKILIFVQKNKNAEIKQKNEKLILRFNNIDSVKNALKILQKIKTQPENT